MTLLSVLELDLLDGRIDDEDARVVLLRIGGNEIEATAVGGVLLGETPELLAVLEFDHRFLSGRGLDAETFGAVDLAARRAVILHVEQRLQVVEPYRRRNPAPLAGQEVERIAIRPEILRVSSLGLAILEMGHDLVFHPCLRDEGLKRCDDDDFVMWLSASSSSWRSRARTGCQDLPDC